MLSMSIVSDHSCHIFDSGNGHILETFASPDLIHDLGSLITRAFSFLQRSAFTPWHERKLLSTSSKTPALFEATASKDLIRRNRWQIPDQTAEKLR